MYPQYVSGLHILTCGGLGGVTALVIPGWTVREAATHPRLHDAHAALTLVEPWATVAHTGGALCWHPENYNE